MKRWAWSALFGALVLFGLLPASVLASGETYTFVNNGTAIWGSGGSYTLLKGSNTAAAQFNGGQMNADIVNFDADFVLTSNGKDYHCTPQIAYYRNSNTADISGVNKSLFGQTLFGLYGSDCSKFITAGPIKVNGTIAGKDGKLPSTPKTEAQVPAGVTLDGTTSAAAASSQTTAPTGAAASTDAATALNDCYTHANVLGYIICPAIETISNSITSLFNNVIVGMLTVDPLQDGSLKKIWDAFRSLSTIGLVLVFLIIIFANVTSINIDAYTIKKMLPKLVAATILIQFSWLICGILVDVGNILGTGIAQLVLSSLPQSASSASAGGPSFQLLASFAIVGGIGLGAIVAAGLVFAPFLLAMLIGLFFAIAAFLITLVLRLMAINILVALSPIALLAWILPGTEKIFKLWYTNFVKLIMMYPLMILIITAGVIVEKTSTGGLSLISIFAPMAAFFMLPMVFKMSGGVMSAASGAVAARTSKVGGAIKGGEAMKGLKATQTERNQMRAMSNNPFARTAGRIGLGTLGAGQIGQRKLRSGFSSALTARGKDLEPQFQTMETSAIKSKLLDSSNKLNKNVGADYQAKAIETLASRGDFDTLRTIKGQMAGASAGAGSNAIWAHAMANSGSTVMQEAPDLIKGPGAFTGVTAAKLADWHGSTTQEALDHFSSTSHAVGTPEYTQWANDKATFYEASHAMLSSPTLSGKSKVGTKTALAGSAGIFTAESTAAKSKGLEVNALHDRLDPTTGAVIKDRK